MKNTETGVKDNNKCSANANTARITACVPDLASVMNQNT